LQKPTKQNQKQKQKQNKKNFPHSTALHTPHSSPDFQTPESHTDDDRGWQRKEILAVMSDET